MSGYQKTTDVPRHRVLAKITGAMKPGYETVLTPDALLFLADLERRFGRARKNMLEYRQDRQDRFDYGEFPTFLPETEHIRAEMWEVDPIPAALRDRRVEITGPVERKMMINALNSGAKMFMADFEDASSPTFANMIEGQINMYDYARGKLSYHDRAKDKDYTLNEETATMLVRPRGWHMEEDNITVDGRPMSASLVDFGLHIFHNGKILAKKGVGPFYYLPKMESHKEARLWNDVFNYAQTFVGIPHGTIKSTVLIETLPAAFEMDEILYELRAHITGLNCGRWDYIFSYIKCLRNHREFVLPDRAQVGMDKAFLRAYSLKLIETCHRRRAHAMGGMAAQIPVKGDDTANEIAFAKLKADKEREVLAGHDGTWVAHPGMVAAATEVFDEHMPKMHQILRKELGAKVSEASMLTPHTGSITEAGVRTNISVGIIYIAAWLGGRGAVPIHNLMEDAATAEISRSQIWQWLRHGASVELKDGSQAKMTSDLFDRIFKEEMGKLEDAMSVTEFRQGHYTQAAEIFKKTATSVDFIDFLTLPAYRQLLKLN
ncbi:MAG TPA: malate synthase A [Hellea balneolensis]|uniref:malate synthase n=1 Tax=Hellea balneolensis TaxID=287478 RepID=A0A7C3GBQ5_9PROT|nr:malate synthase A [Hellea balneolensis]